MKILIADDHPIFRKGLASVLVDKMEGTEVLEAENGKEASDLLEKETPDVAILDIEMPSQDGLKVCQNIKAASLPTKVIILTMYKNEEIFKIAMAAGADGFVLKDNSARELMECIAEVLKGNEYISSEMRKYLSGRGYFLNREKDLRGNLNDLTKTETKVLLLVSKNFSSKEIAERLFVTPKSVENYRSRICKKLGLEGGNNSLTRWVMENNNILKLIDPSFNSNV